MPPLADIHAGLVLHTSSQISGCLGGSAVSTARISLPARPGKGIGPPSCPVQLNTVGTLPERQAMLSLGKRLVPISGCEGLIKFWLGFFFFLLIAEGLGQQEL